MRWDAWPTTPHGDGLNLNAWSLETGHRRWHCHCHCTFTCYWCTVLWTLFNHVATCEWSGLTSIVAVVCQLIAFLWLLHLCSSFRTHHVISETGAYHWLRDSSADWEEDKQIRSRSMSGQMWLCSLERHFVGTFTWVHSCQTRGRGWWCHWKSAILLPSRQKIDQF